MKSIKIGFAPTRRSIFSAPDAVKYANLTRERLKELGVEFVDITDINEEGLFYDEADREKIQEKFRRENVKGIFFPHGNFGTEYVCARLAKEMGLPVLLWGPRDERPDENGVRLRDSQCGLFATGKVLRRFGVPFTYMTNCRLTDPEFERGIPDTLVATGKANLIKGVQTNLWSEYMYNTDLLEYRAYPRVLALAEIGWTPLARKDYKDFERRLDNALVRLDELNINYHIPQPEQPNGSCDFVAFTDKASLEFKTTRPVKVVYTIDGTEPTPESTAYSAPIEFTESGVLKIRSVLPSGKMSKTRTITVEKQALAPAREVAKTTPGLEMQVTDGMFLNSSKLGDVKEWKKSVIKDLREITSVVKSSESMRGVKQYAAIATGYVNIPEDGVYYISSDNEEVWIDGKLLVNNAGEVKRFSRHDSSAALSKGLHEIKVVFLGHIIGGWPSNWNDGSVKLRKDDSDKFVKITPEMLVH